MRDSESSSAPSLGLECQIGPRRCELIVFRQYDHTTDERRSESGSTWTANKESEFIAFRLIESSTPSQPEAFIDASSVFRDWCTIVYCDSRAGAFSLFLHA